MPFEPFLRPKLRGARFEGGVIPLDVLLELHAYGELVTEIARALFLQRHPSRKRVGKAFRNSSKLVLRGTIGEGSALPPVDRWVPEEQLELIGTNPDEFVDARELVGESVLAGAAGKPFPVDIDPELLASFAGFGKRLRPGESIELIPPGATKGPLYDLSVRRKILERVSTEPIEEPVELRGSLHGVDVKSRTFTFEHFDSDIYGSYDPLFGKRVLEALSAYEGDHKTRSVVRGIGRVEGGRVTRILQVYDVDVEPDPSAEITKMQSDLAELRDLEDGWLDGSGEAPPKEGLEWLGAFLARALDQGIPCPRIYPTELGGVRAEWLFGRWDVSAEFDLKVNEGAYLHALQLDTDEDEELELSIADGDPVGQFVDFIGRHRGEGAASAGE